MPLRSQHSSRRRIVLLLSALCLTAGIITIYAPDIEVELKRGLAWIFAQQRVFHREMITTLRHLAQNADSSTSFWLILISFTYGIFHAVGPGHGKAVVSTFLLTNKVQLRRGLCISVGGSLLQGISAITIVYGLVWAFGWHTAETTSLITWSSRFSYALLVLVGAAWLVIAFRLLVGTPNTETGHHHHHHHHTPEIKHLDVANSPRAIISMMLAIGLRPCSGAVLVLIFAYTVQIPIAGMAAAMAMAVGTAITVSTLAILAVKIHDLLHHMGEDASAGSAQRSQRIRRKIAGGMSLVCGALVLLFGASLLIQSFSTRLGAGVL